MKLKLPLDQKQYQNILNFFSFLNQLESDTFGEVIVFVGIQPTSFFPTKISANLYWLEIPRGVSGQKFHQVVWVEFHRWQQIPPQLREETGFMG